MPTRSARNPIRSALAVVALTASLAGPVLADEAPGVTLDLAQARVLAVHALREGRPELAMGVAGGLLKADPEDPLAHHVLAGANARLDRPGAAHKSAARAYRFSEPGLDRFRSAQMAARMALAQDRPTTAQFWLRRSALHAPDARAAEVVARDYRALRRINPWSFRLRLDLRPSSNVNKGSDTALQIIDGIPVTGVLSGAAQALSGVIGSVDLSSAYRLRQNKVSETRASGRLYVQRVALSSSAQATAPSAENGDFASTFAEVSLRHSWLVGGAPGRGTMSLGATLGESWYGGGGGFGFGRIEAARKWRLGGAGYLRLDGLAERRFRARFAANDVHVLGIGAEWGRELANGDRLSLRAAWRDTGAERANGTFTAASLRASYAPDQALGPVQISAGLTLGHADYPAFRSGLFWVPGGRQDRSVYGDLNLFFHEMDYAGFAPMLRLRAGRKHSNDSRFEMREVSVSLGIESVF
ncbi:MAG TPA: hypothetical protein DEA05_00875 [Rhodobacteraceae bacterium]|nr:hypothetical protein [Paracoccaceae bacterium]